MSCTQQSYRITLTQGTQSVPLCKVCLKMSSPSRSGLSKLAISSITEITVRSRDCVHVQRLISVCVNCITLATIFVCPIHCYQLQDNSPPAGDSTCIEQLELSNGENKQSAWILLKQRLCNDATGLFTDTKQLH